MCGDAEAPGVTQYRRLQELHGGNLYRKRQVYTKIPGYKLGFRPHIKAHGMVFVKGGNIPTWQVSHPFPARSPR
jgi:hypothetical protein